MDITRSSHLYCQHGSSDKVYLLSIVRNNGRFQVVAQYGKRDAQHLKTEIKIDTTSWRAAEEKFNAIARVKMFTTKLSSRYTKNPKPGRDRITALADAKAERAIEVTVTKETLAPKPDEGFLNLKI